MKLKDNATSLIICLILSSILIACSGQDPSTASNAKSAFEQSESMEENKEKSTGEEQSSEKSIADKEDAAGKVPEGYSVVAGTWKVGGIYYNGNLIDINDNDGLKSMYDTIMITFNEDGSFVYLKKYNDRGSWSEKKPGSEDTFVLNTESTFMYELQNGSLVEKETKTSNKKQYIVVLLDENTFILNEYDSITGKAKANDSPYFFVKQGESSKFIADNKTPVNNSGSTQSGTDKKPSQHNDASTSNATSGEKNALAKALQYLDYSAFSYSGLVEQLEYEGFSHSEASFAADHCGADWKEQAVEKSLSYLDYSAFSYDGLIEQLEYEGFTSSEAQYGADNCGADWNAEAVKKAREYLQYTSFSRSELIDQLLFEGFTQSQAEYGVNAVY